MLTSEEIRGAMARAHQVSSFGVDPITAPVVDAQSYSVLISAVWELYEALDDALVENSHACHMEAKAVQDRYHAALEGGEDE